MNDFQEQAKNWLRNVVKQNPDKIKAGVEKAGDLIDKQTGGKYAGKVDAVQEKVGKYVDSQSGAGTPGQPSAESPAEETVSTSSGPEAETGTGDGAPDAAGQAGSSGGNVAAPGGGTAPDGGVVGGEVPDPSSEPYSSAGSQPEGAQTGGTATGRTDGEDTPPDSEGGLPGPR